MKVAPDIAHALIKLYANTGKTVWVYKADDGQLAFDAIVDEEDPFVEHRQREDFWLEGSLDYDTGLFVPFYKDDIEEVREAVVVRPEWLDLLYMLSRALIYVCFAAVAFFFLLVGVLAGGGVNPTRGKRSR